MSLQMDQAAGPVAGNAEAQAAAGPVASNAEAQALRQARRNRVGQETTDGVFVKAKCGGKTFTRCFNIGSCYQEVYDWIGCREDLPLHFILLRTPNPCPIKRDEKISQSETVVVSEVTQEQEFGKMHTTVSLRGDFVYTNDNESTINEGDSAGEENKKYRKRGRTSKEKKNKKKKL
ncbi:uncharacterized protein LOC116304643 isoform X3 [Actinia tenebrosa]|uniref:Uncharacterized protein LOC116304643 isoform X2 n=1 Tax=Actinia tenebrosa TaxID=6105 RepID=A0A6P8IVX9_ACTTE|nr:uncharacterized protein LOC116304643 isoform X2 [Actinia tenebrosa]XP_031570264.1 uncharacterized protein LOC116304643 isoform X3 [Actinia tenebrosa]